MSLVYGLSTLAALMIGYYVFTLVHKPIESEKHIKGRRLLEKSAAAKDAKINLSRAHRSGGGKGLQIHPAITLSRAQEVQSFLFMACQGGGKTQILWRLLNAAISRSDKNNNFLGDKVIIYDLVKGDFTRSVGNSPNGAPPVLISPWDKRSQIWDIGRDCRTLADAISFSCGLIPMSSEPIWALAARALLTAIFVKLQEEYGVNWGWNELYPLAYLPIEDLKPIAQQYYPPAIAACNEASKTSESIYINLHTFLSPIYRLYLLYKDSKNPKFSFMDFINDDLSRKRVIILQGNLEDKELSGAYLRAITEMIANRVASVEFEESTERRCWMVIDETIQMGLIECLAKFMEYGRSKGFTLVLSIQDVSQVRQLYPLHEDQKWLSLCGIKIYGQIRGGESQKFVSAEAGTRIVERYSQSVSKNTSSENERNVNSSYVRDNQAQVIHESELETLGITDENGGGIKAIVMGVGTNALKLQWSFYSPPKIRRPFVSRRAKTGENTNNSNLRVNESPIATKEVNSALKTEVYSEAETENEVFSTLETTQNEVNSTVKTQDDDFLDELTKEVTNEALDEITDSHLSVALEIVDAVSEIVNSEQNQSVNEVSMSNVEQNKKKRYISRKSLQEQQF
jgi:hypothetical protein